MSKGRWTKIPLLAPTGRPSMELDETGVRTLLAIAEESSRTWSADAPQRYAAAVRAAQIIGDAGVSDEVWHSLGIFFLARALPLGSFRAYQQALDSARSRDDRAAANRALRGQYFTLVIMGEERAAVAVTAMLQRAGGLADLPAPAELLAEDQRGTIREGEADRFLDDGYCQREIARAMERLDILEIPSDLLELLDAMDRTYASDPTSRLLPLLALEREARERPEWTAMRRAEQAKRNSMVRAARLMLGLAGISLAIGAAFLVAGAGGWTKFGGSGAGLLVGALCAARWLACRRRVSRLDQNVHLTGVISALLTADEAEVSSHSEAEDVVRRYLRSGGAEPFALLLRSFINETIVTYGTDELPRRISLDSTPPEQRSVLMNIHNELTVEASLDHAIGSVMPMIAVSNPDLSALRPPGLVLPRLEIVRERWPIAVAFLIYAAHVIVVDCPELTSGVRFELGLIRQLAKMSSTVVILPSEGTIRRLEERHASEDDSAQTFLTLRPSAGNPRPFALAGMAPLQGFDRTIIDTDLAGSPAGVRQVFDGLLPPSAPAQQRPGAADDVTDLSADESISGPIDVDHRTDKIGDLAVALLEEDTEDAVDRALDLLTNVLGQSKEGYWLDHHIGIAYLKLARDHGRPCGREAVAALTRAIDSGRTILSPETSRFLGYTFTALASAVAQLNVPIQDVRKADQLVSAALGEQPFTDDAEFRIRVRSNVAVGYLRGRRGRRGRDGIVRAREILQECLADCDRNRDAVAPETRASVLSNLNASRPRR